MVPFDRQPEGDYEIRPKGQWRVKLAAARITLAFLKLSPLLAWQQRIRSGLVPPDIRGGSLG